MEDRRGRGTVKKAGGIGLGGLIIVGLVTLLMGGDPSDVINMAGQALGGLIMIPFGKLEIIGQEQLKNAVALTICQVIMI